MCCRSFRGTALFLLLKSALVNGVFVEALSSLVFSLSSLSASFLSLLSPPLSSVSAALSGSVSDAFVASETGDDVVSSGGGAAGFGAEASDVPDVSFGIGIVRVMPHTLHLHSITPSRFVVA